MDPRLTGLDWKTSLSALLDLVLPRVCLVCGRPLLPRERHLCTECLADLPETHYATLARNPMADRFNARIRVEEYEPYAYAAALFHYRAEAGYKKIPQALKYGFNLAAGRYFAGKLGALLSSAGHFADVDTVIPVPLHWWRKWRRGYNQAEVIAAELASALHARLRAHALVRLHRTRSQTRLGAEDRLKNTEGVFRLPHSFPARHVLLVDDTFTTGATLLACYNAVRKALGPSVRISIATLAVVEA